MKSRAPLVLALMTVFGLGFAATAPQSMEPYGSQEDGSLLYLAQAERGGDAGITEEGAAGAGANEQAAGESDQSRIIKTTDFVGRQVLDAQGEDLGEIHDVVLNRDGSVSYVVLSYGETLGIGGKLVAVPWDRIQFGGSADEPLKADISKDRLADLKDFDDESYPEQPDFAAFEQGSGGDVSREGDVRQERMEKDVEQP